VRNPNRIRIIGGEWRGRKLAVPNRPGLRPTPDRVRETLFNWLQPVISGARCLDLFAGSGALGWEALSRGAGELVMVDRDRQTVETLRDTARLLGCDRVTVVQADALDYLSGTARSFDIVFLDPPFRKGWLVPCMERLERGGWLSPHARIYFEHESELQEPPLPPGWRPARGKRAGQVSYNLAVRTQEPA